MMPSDKDGDKGMESNSQMGLTFEDSDDFSLIEVLRMNQTELQRQNSELLTIQARLEESRNQYSELYDFAPVGYLTIDRRGYIEQINLVGAHMLGEQREALVGQSFASFLAEGFHEIFARHHQEVLQSSDRESGEVEVIRKDGTHFYAHLESMRVNGRGAPSDRYRSAISDITRRKVMENALRESKLKNLAILNTIPDMIFIQDKEGVYIDFHAEDRNSPFISGKEFLGKTSKDVLPASIGEILDQLLRRTLESGRPNKMDYSLPLNGTLHYYETRMVRLGEDKVLSIVRDVSEARQAEKDLQAAHDSLEKRVEERTAEIEEINRLLKKEIKQRKKMEKVRAKTQRMETIGALASGVAHEVRNPLNSIQAIIAVLNQELGDHEEFLQCGEHINIQVERLSRLMKDLLELGKQTDTEEFVKIPSLPVFCESTVKLWEKSMTECEYRVVTDTEQGADEVEIMGDMGKLQQVFINLLDNATQHSPKGSMVMIKLCSPTRRFIRIQVIDQGSGIKPGNLPHVFEPFFTKRHSGTGLGLSIVKNIIENHSGSIKVRNNEPPPGCLIEITLPLTKID